MDLAFEKFMGVRTLEASIITLQPIKTMDLVFERFMDAPIPRLTITIHLQTPTMVVALTGVKLAICYHLINGLSNRYLLISFELSPTDQETIN